MRLHVPARPRLAVQQRVLDQQVGDVNGDGVPDLVYLTGQKYAPDAAYLIAITLHIRDGRTRTVQSIRLPENSGYQPTVYLGDFTGNQVKDILVRIDTGGSGATTNDYVYTYFQQHYRNTFDSAVYNQTYSYKVDYVDGYRVRVSSKLPAKVYMLDIQYKGPEYLNEIYEPDGQLKQPIEGFVNPLSALIPVDLQRDGLDELQAYQKIAGRYNADSLGYMMNTLKWQGNGFSPLVQAVQIPG
ncbi:FG-GAP-like repeat-containing protein [Marinicrinis sediminis]|uniref:FG-GAP-like repeat-containing protein n=1 Tax=Marinicrinis sediminis TaxID=1652465 RepID=A0ABW5RC09_9BACL